MDRSETLGEPQLRERRGRSRRLLVGAALYVAAAAAVVYATDGGALGQGAFIALLVGGSFAAGAALRSWWSPLLAVSLVALGAPLEGDGSASGAVFFALVWAPLAALSLLCGVVAGRIAGKAG